VRALPEFGDLGRQRFALALQASHVTFEHGDALAGDPQFGVGVRERIAHAVREAGALLASHVGFDEALPCDEEFALERCDGFARHSSNAPPAMSRQPLVSIVIPVYNRSADTKSCLSALVASGALALEPEVIVADDASTDDTADVVARFAFARRLRNAYRLGFARTCNRAASHAAGRYVVFLDNRTLVRFGWLDWLVATAEERPQAGAVVSKVLWPEGKLAEAGLLLAREGTGHAYGAGDDPAAPRYNYVRAADGGAHAMLVRRDAFYEAGGFSEYLASARLCIHDFTFALADRGLTCFYQPQSTVVRFDATAHGSDDADDASREHRARFLRRRRNALARRPPVADETTARLHGSAHGVLIADDRPYGPEVRAHLLARQAAGTHVAYAPLGGLLLPQRRDLQQEGIEVLYPYAGKTLEDVIAETRPFVRDFEIPGKRIERLATARPAS